jgi:hypothetical protein
MGDKIFPERVREGPKPAPIPLEGTSDGEHASTEEALACLDGLTEEEWLALETASDKYRLWLPSEDVDELMGEAVQRVLDGRRKWPRRVELAPFLVEVMRSIASEWLGKNRRRAVPESRVAQDASDDAEDAEGYIDRHAAPGPGTDGQTRLREIVERVENAFGNDDAVTAILIGRVE